MARQHLTREKYEFREVKVDRDAGTSAVLFTVDLPTGQSRDELLSFTTIETRIRLWDEAVAQTPALGWEDALGLANYHEYVRALVEGLKLQVV